MLDRHPLLRIIGQVLDAGKLLQRRKKRIILSFNSTNTCPTVKPTMMKGNSQSAQSRPNTTYTKTTPAKTPAATVKPSTEVLNTIASALEVDELELDVVFEVTALVLMTHGFVTPEAVRLTELPTLEAVIEVLSNGEVKILPLPAPLAVRLGAVNGRYISTSG